MPPRPIKPHFSATPEASRQSEKVCERFKLIDGGRTIELNVHVEDPVAFTTPWKRYRRVDDGPMVEMVRAENNAGYFDYDVVATPQAVRTHF